MVDLDAARTRLRRDAILRALYLVWPRPMGQGLLAEALPDDLNHNRTALARDLDYMASRGHVAAAGAAGAGVALYRLTADGVDAYESGPAYPPDGARNLRMLRLRVMQALDLGRPQPLGTRLISAALATDLDLDLSDPALRRALAYLGERGLVEAGAYAIGPAGHTFAPRPDPSPDTAVYRLTAAGIDYLAGEGAGITGVARPLGW